MKKLLVMILCMVLLTGCGNRTDSQDSEGAEGNMFVCVQPTDLNDYYVVYQKDTKVMYAVSTGYYNRGNFSLLVNPDGTPMLYEAESEEEE